VSKNRPLTVQGFSAHNLGRIHHRQAVILEAQNEETWLSRDTPLEQAYKLLKPLSAAKMEMFRIDEWFNKTRADEISPEMVS
jgi:putative SOS response-associated peptidase YedK